MKSFFTVQYSHALDKFFLTEMENPEQGTPFDIPIIDCENGSSIEIGSFMIDTEIIECSKPTKLVIANPYNDLLKGHKLGLLYNWFALSHPNFAPAGWHVPSTAELNALVYQVGSEATSGGILKETGTDFWSAPNRQATNAVGFNARGGGVRYESGTFSELYRQAVLGTSSQYNTYGVHVWLMYYSGQVIRTLRFYNTCGLSTRLVKDDDQDPGFLTDIDANSYPTVKIGNMVWLAANWKCTRFNNGNPIPNVQDNAEWAALNSPAYCAYNNDNSLV